MSMMASSAAQIEAPNAGIEAAEAELWEALEKIPSQFERLLYLASIADQPDANQSEVIRREHQAAFEEWLALSLREKQADFRLYAEIQGRSASSLLLSFSQPQNQKSLVPSWALQAQRDHFAMELEVLFLIA